MGPWNEKDGAHEEPDVDAVELGCPNSATKSFKYLLSSFELKIRETLEESVHRWTWPYWESAREGEIGDAPEV